MTRRRPIRSIDVAGLPGQAGAIAPGGLRTVDSVNRDYPPGDLRASDADRDRAVGELSQHFEAGRLTAEELDERTGRALRARTGKELTELLADLPRHQDPLSGTAAGPGCAGPANRLAGKPVTRIAIAALVIAALVGSHGLVVLVLAIAVLVVIRRRARGGRSRGRGWEGL
jgi:hypothetical protein